MRRSVPAPPPSKATGNRRVERPETEDAPAVTTKKRAAKSAPRRLRAWLNRLSLLTGIVVVAIASVAVAWGLRRYLRTSPRFSVRDIHVEGHQRRTPQQLAKRAGIEMGHNIFGVDEGVAAAALETDPWIETATVKVELPSAVSLTVTEREARALAILEGRLYLVDTKGNVFKELTESDPSDLPVVTGIDAEQVAEDRDAVTATVRRALELADDLERAKIVPRYPLQELHLESDGAVTVIIGTDGLELFFGNPPYRAKVDKAERILEELRYRKVKRAALFLDNRAHPERVVVRLRETVKE